MALYQLENFNSNLDSDFVLVCAGTCGLNGLKTHLLYTDAVADAKKSLRLDPNNSTALLRKGYEKIALSLAWTR